MKNKFKNQITQSMVKNTKTAKQPAKPTTKPTKAKVAPKKEVPKPQKAKVEVPKKVEKKVTPPKKEAAKKPEKKEKEDKRDPKLWEIAETLVKSPSDKINEVAKSYNLSGKDLMTVGNYTQSIIHKTSKQGEYSANNKIKLHYKDSKKFRELYTEALGKKKDELMKILQSNGQAKSANKELLAERVADGKLLGRIPKCPSCTGGRLRFNMINGQYYCAGFGNSSNEYVFCNKVFNTKDIVREKFHS